MDNLESKEKKDNQHFWNIVFSLIFLTLIAYAVSLGRADEVRAFVRISPFHFIIIILATFRLTRLFVADHITEWLRDLSMKNVIVKDSHTGTDYVRCEKPSKGVRRLISDLFGCPWCMGVWMAFVSLVLYYVAMAEDLPFAWIVLLIFAIAGAAEVVYALIVALMAPHAGGSFLLDQRGINLLSGQKHEQAPNVCTDCGGDVAH